MESDDTDMDGPLGKGRGGREETTQESGENQRGIRRGKGTKAEVFSSVSAQSRGRGYGTYRGRARGVSRGRGNGQYGTRISHNQDRRGGRQGRGSHQRSSRFRQEEYSEGMDFDRMTQLMDSMDHEILITLVKTSSGFEQELDINHSSPKDHKRMLMKLNLMAKCCSCESAPQYTFQFLKMVNASALVKHGHLNQFLMDVTKNEDIPAEKYSKGISDLLVLIKTFFIRMPSSDFVNKARLTLLAIEGLINGNNEAVTNDIRLLVDDIQTLSAQRAEKINQSKQSASEEESGITDREAPPNDFREMSVIPSVHDVYPNEDTFLRVNKLKGRYENLEHYLDVQYRLLREDFIHPLRNGILSYLDIKNGRAPQDTKLTDVRIYRDVHILGTVCSNHELVYVLDFDAANVTWENSKHLIFGSLLALTCDDFDKMYICTVVSRGDIVMNRGQVEVHVEHDDAQFSLFQPEVTFTMAETSAFFESYRHVLTALKNITPDFPFQDYLVRCCKSIQLPGYLQQNIPMRLDFSPLVDRSNGSSLRDVLVQEVDEWPTAEELNLDESQYQALQRCLTKEFALVQGPPGTGKTFLGLKVVQLLLHNWDKWNKKEDNAPNRPVLVVCYTNHALDQFLEGIQKMSNKKVVRVGSQSKSDSLKECSLNSIRNDMRKQWKIPQVLYKAFNDLQSDMSELQSKIYTASCVIESMDNHIIQLFRLQNVMREAHRNQFDKYRYGKCDPLINWMKEEKYGGCYNDLQLDNQRDEITNVENTTKHKTKTKFSIAEHSIAEFNEDLDQMERSRHLGENECEDEKKKEKLMLMAAVKQTYFVQNMQTDETSTNDQDESSWKIQQRTKIRQIINHLPKTIKRATQMTNEESQNIPDISCLPIKDRYRLYKYWKELYKRKLHQGCRRKKETYQGLAQQLKEARHQLDKAIMQTAAVVAMTTTAAARYHLVLQEIQPRIIIVEEAAEVLEAHIVTSISRNCEHLILIGDHKQLRPSANVYELAKHYHLDISLFERMVNNKIPIQTLVMQHRMRPAISKLMKPFYKNLQDDISVQKYPLVKGVMHNLYFVTHNILEDDQEDVLSNKNEFEALFIQRFCKYLIQQNYDPSQITILTPYTGQLRQLKDMMNDSCHKVRIAVVDNFQGEENDIILLSLVRDNLQGKLGFLKMENRVCVALSRAKIGLYVIGNIDFLANHSDIWTKIKTIAEQEGVIGSALPLACQQHPDTKINASSPEDFDAAPEGGCLRPCEVRLDCGHVCPRACHSYDLQHTLIECSKPCTRNWCDQHHCTKLCSEECGPCMVPVTKVIAECNHEDLMPCHQDPATWDCTKPCERTLPCNHLCTLECEMPCICKVKVTRKLPCGHEGTMKCYKNIKKILCRYPCNTLLMCGHLCNGTCGSCYQGRIHQKCSIKCGRMLVCGHICDEPCGNACPPCKKMCETQCSHSRCTKYCGERCVPCKEPCLWRCKHYKCSKLCSEPCDRPKCNEPCEEVLSCGHPCIGLCGETCPSHCRICDKKLVSEIFFGDEDKPNALFVVLDCGHIVEVEGMDVWVTTGTENTISLQKCPKCSTPIRKTPRYNSVTKTTLSDIEEVKKKSFGDFNQTEKANQLIRKLDILKSGIFRRHVLNHLEKRHPPGKQERRQHVEQRFLRVFKRLSLPEYASLENLMNFVHRRDLLGYAFCGGRIGSYCDTLREMLDAWLEKAIVYCHCLSQQQCIEVSQELARLSMAAKLYQVKQKLKDIASKTYGKTEAAEAKIAAKKKKVNDIFKILRSIKHYDIEHEQQLQDDLKVVERSLRVGCLGISEDERVQIVQAMQLKQGHWFKCPEGHIYFITECRGTTEESTCPDCGQR